MMSLTTEVNFRCLFLDLIMIFVVLEARSCKHTTISNQGCKKGMLTMIYQIGKNRTLIY